MKQQDRVVTGWLRLARHYHSLLGGGPGAVWPHSRGSPSRARHHMVELVMEAQISAAWLDSTRPKVTVEKPQNGVGQAFVACAALSLQFSLQGSHWLQLLCLLGSLGEIQTPLSCHLLLVAQVCPCDESQQLVTSF